MSTALAAHSMPVDVHVDLILASVRPFVDMRTTMDFVVTRKLPQSLRSTMLPVQRHHFGCVCPLLLRKSSRKFKPGGVLSCVLSEGVCYYRGGVILRVIQADVSYMGCYPKGCFLACYPRLCYPRGCAIPGGVLSCVYSKGVLSQAVC